MFRTELFHGGDFKPILQANCLLQIAKFSEKSCLTASENESWIPKQNTWNSIISKGTLHKETDIKGTGLSILRHKKLQVATKLAI